MRRECFDEVHVGLPVLDDAVVVTGQHPVLVVTPHHGAHCTVVGLDVLSAGAHDTCDMVAVLALRTCIIVSKLNADPFHKVNSPEELPVINRRPSGVHCALVSIANEPLSTRMYLP